LAALAVFGLLACRNDAGAVEQTKQAAMPQSQAPAQQPAGKLPAGHPPVAVQGNVDALPPVAPTAGQGAGALVWTVPATWVAETPASAMRRAQYRLPGDAGAAECIVFYFGPGQGGDPQSNAERWGAQFADASGKPVAAKTSAEKVGGIDVLRVEAKGTYVGAMMMGGGAQPAPKAGYMLLGAVASGPDSNWFFKLTGPEKTVEDHRAAFGSLIASLRPGS
jgi:hypothetical protein